MIPFQNKRSRTDKYVCRDEYERIRGTTRDQAMVSLLLCVYSRHGGLYTAF